MYDYYLGGKDNFRADREAAEKALSAIPDGRRIAHANRRFLVRAVKYLAGHGIRQYIDLGTGIPTSPNVHEVAREIIPDARVVYVDNDPIVAIHNSILLANHDDKIAAIHRDIRDPLDVLSDNELRKVIDFDEPVGLLLVAVLHFLADIDDPHGCVTAFKESLAPGSYVAISHITRDGTSSEIISQVEKVYEQASAPAVFRSGAQILDFFANLELVEPGLVEVSNWQAHEMNQADLSALRFLAGVGRKQ